MATIERLYTFDQANIFLIVLGILWFLSMVYFLFRRSTLPLGTALTFINPLLAKTMEKLRPNANGRNAAANNNASSVGSEPE